MKNIFLELFKWAFWALLFSAALFAGPAWGAEPYAISEPVSALTRIVAPDRPGQETVRTWEILPETMPEGFRLNFFKSGADQAFGRLLFDRDDNTVAWEGPGADAPALKKGRLLIIPGFPPPCDVLPVSRFWEGEASKIYAIRREFGGHVFLDRVRVTAEPCDAAEAFKNGWISEGSEATEFRLITAKDAATGELMVRQLWPAAAEWWVYEETPNRRSWRKK